MFPHMLSKAARVDAALSIRLSISLSKNNLLLMVDSKYVNLSTTSNSKLLRVILGDVVACVTTFVFMRLIVSP